MNPYQYARNIKSVNLTGVQEALEQALLLINEELLKDCKIGELGLDFFQDTLDFIKAHEKAFYLFLIKRPNYRFIEKWKAGIKYHLYARVTLSIDKRNKEFTLEMIETN